MQSFKRSTNYSDSYARLLEFTLSMRTTYLFGMDNLELRTNSVDNFVENISLD